MIDEDVFKRFWAIACDVWEERGTVTAKYYHEELSERLDTDAFVAAAKRLLNRESWFPNVDDFVAEARAIQRREARRKGKIIALRRAEEEKQRLQEAAREMYEEEELSAREIGRLVAQGEIDVGKRMGEALPPGAEESYRKADRVDRLPSPDEEQEEAS